MTQAQAALDEAQQKLAAMQAGGDAASIAQAQANLTQAQNNQSSLTNPSQSDLSAAQAKVTQAQNNQSSIRTS